MLLILINLDFIFRILLNPFLYSILLYGLSYGYLLLRFVSALFTLHKRNARVFDYLKIVSDTLRRARTANRSAIYSQINTIFAQ